MSIVNQEVMDKVTEKMQDEGLPVPFALKGKLSEEESLIMHIFLDHVFTGMYQNIKQARKELKSYLKEHKGSEIIQELKESMDETYDDIQKVWNDWSKDIEPLPSIDELKTFMKKLNKEMAAAAALAISEEKDQGNEVGGATEQ